MEDASRDDFDALERCFDAGLLDGSLRHEPSTTANNLLHFARLAQFGLQFLWTRLENDSALVQGTDSEIEVCSSDSCLIAVVRVVMLLLRTVPPSCLLHGTAKKCRLMTLLLSLRL